MQRIICDRTFPGSKDRSQYPPFQRTAKIRGFFLSTIPNSSNPRGIKQKLLRREINEPET